jgi:hypothetical protein
MCRLLAFAALAASIVAAMAVPAQGQGPVLGLQTELSITPKKTGVKEHPRGVRLSGKVGFEAPDGIELPIVAGGSVLLPRGIAYNGGSYPACARRTLVEEGPAGCPGRSRMGTGSDRSIGEEVSPKAKTVFVNGGPRRIWAYTSFIFPALVQVPIPIDVKRLDHRKWGLHLSFKVPESLFVIAGIPISAPTSFGFSVGGGR